jgi:hypothetical protein
MGEGGGNIYGDASIDWRSLQTAGVSQRTPITVH